MTYFDDYKNRMDYSGSTFKDGVENNTKQVIEHVFKDSPSYKLITINGVNVDSIIESGKNSTEKGILFKPSVTYDIGTLVEFDSNKWLTLDFKNHSIYPRASVKLCNTTIKTEDIYTESETGTTPWGEPVIEETLSQEGLDIPCIVDKSVLSPYEDDVINFPHNKAQVTIQYTTDSRIDINKTITLYDDVYEIVDIDKTKSMNGSGLFIIHVQRRK